MSEGGRRMWPRQPRMPRARLLHGLSMSSRAGLTGLSFSVQGRSLQRGTRGVSGQFQSEHADCLAQSGQSGRRVSKGTRCPEQVTRGFLWTALTCLPLWLRTRWEFYQPGKTGRYPREMRGRPCTRTDLVTGYPVSHPCSHELRYLP